MSQTYPLVTVYIPTFNRVGLLTRAVESVLSQTYQNFEIIIVDDCSTDGTQAYIKDLVSKDDRIKYFFKEKNSGACASRNIAIERASGDFITGLDDDDYFVETRLEDFVAAWDDNFSCLFSFNNFKKTKDSFRNNRRHAMKNIVTQRDLLKANFIGNQVFTKTAYLLQIGGFDINMKVWQDLECWYRLLKLKPGKRVEKILYVVDVSHEHERITNNKGEKVLSTFNYFVEKHRLNHDETLDLETHITNYKGVKLSLKVYFRKLNNFRSLGNLFKIFKKILNIE